MAGESVAELLAQLTATTGESAADIYAKWAGLTLSYDDSLYRLVSRKLAANGKSAQRRESLEATIAAGGGVGESLEEMLRKTGLTGWS